MNSGEWTFLTNIQPLRGKGGGYHMLNPHLNPGSESGTFLSTHDSSEVVFREHGEEKLFNYMNSNCLNLNCLNKLNEMKCNFPGV